MNSLHLLLLLTPALALPAEPIGKVNAKPVGIWPHPQPKQVAATPAKPKTGFQLASLSCRVTPHSPQYNNCVLANDKLQDFSGVCTIPESGCVMLHAVGDCGLWYCGTPGHKETCSDMAKWAGQILTSCQGGNSQAQGYWTLAGGDRVEVRRS